jgi:hypothetical protein
VIIGKNLTGLKYLVLLCRDPEVHLIYTTRESMYLDNQSGLFLELPSTHSARLGMDENFARMSASNLVDRGLSAPSRQLTMLKDVPPESNLNGPVQKPTEAVSTHNSRTGGKDKVNFGYPTQLNQKCKSQITILRRSLNRASVLRD